ncbi:hypothetical protein B0J11DRAFT_205747 [Dendryphion nanum]|uniref:Zn(2)-C6 fungal-type domain-containing protein n=1 Tax=Dendryphion nanum TaxID=256645 RepID=A0A9P9D0S7_9PLEO|nr:hypothetical protein B0J11DRAFT_205747 [Dendryphion nanum]
MPSKSRGLRTSTGCLTCRKRRVKCDETRPRCQNCIRVDRACAYPQADAGPAPRRLRTLSVHENTTTLSSPSPGSAPTPVEPVPVPTLTQTEPTEQPGSAEIPSSFQQWIPFPIDDGENQAPLPENGLLFNDSLPSFGNVYSPAPGPFEWYDLLAEDALSNIQMHNASSREHRWNFDKFSLSRKQTPRHSPSLEPQPNLDINETRHSVVEPWNTATRIELSQEELVYFEHYVSAVGPILDIFDPDRHFATVVPHLALRNVGLLKSLLAVGACHMALDLPQQPEADPSNAMPPSTPASTHSNLTMTSDPSRIGEQYYYETLHYLSQTLLYPSYTSSHEILATAIMISTYEMFGAYGGSDNGNWNRHLKGAFWIQRNQDNNGESVDGLRRAVWWAWLRQDIWAAFREGRPAMTIFQPMKMLTELSESQLATRVVFLAAKCVQYAATPKDGDIAGYIDAGERLMRTLEYWRQILPPSFDPIPVASQFSLLPAASPETPSQFQPIWIHPPSHAAAIQTYHFARILILLNQPSTGGLANYQTRGKMLRDSMSTVCGIAVSQQSQNEPSAFVNFQAVYAAALCAETQDKQAEVLGILEKALNVCKFPAKTMLNDLIGLWSSAR